MGNPRGNPAGRKGKAKVMMLMIMVMMSMYMETTQVWSRSHDLGA